MCGAFPRPGGNALTLKREGCGMETGNGPGAGSTVKSLRTALRLLELVGRERNGARVKDLAAASGVNTASVSKMLSTLAAQGFVRKDGATQRYFLGFKLIELGTRLIETLDIRAAARPVLEELEKATNEVINLAAYHIGDLIYIDKYEGTKSLRMHSKIGGRADWVNTAVGKAVFANLPEHEKAYLLESFAFAPKTPASITSREVFLAQISEVLERGYAVDVEENEMGILCVGAAVFDYSNKPVGAVSISWPVVRGGLERLSTLQAPLRGACAAVSRAMGHRG
jgi:DNA-binding IclR family transcriptional regulator